MTNDAEEPSAASAGYASVKETMMSDDSRLAMGQEIADLRFALRQATDRASLAEVKCSQLFAAGDLLESQLCNAAIDRDRLRLTDAEREAVRLAIGCCEDITYGSPAEPEAAATLRGLLERHAR